MKLLLVMPDAHMHKLRVGSHVRSMREAPLSLTTLAALTPNRDDVEIRVVDGSVDAIPMDADADLVGISCLTGTACEAYRIANHYRGRGIPVVLGGVHVTILPGEAMQHADAIVIGMAERTWPRLIDDFRSGRMEKVYADDAPAGDWIDAPTPRRDLIRRSGYMMPNSVHATRGCRRNCDFCSVPTVWPRYFKRPVADVIEDIKSIPGRLFCFNDVSLVDDLEYARELFTALVPLKKKWGGLATVEIANHPDLLELMSRSGCVYLLLGFESVNQCNLRDIRKGFNRAGDYRRVMEMLHGHGITVQGCFVLGLDEDDASVFARTVEQVLDLRVDIPRYSIYTPYPGTALFKRMAAEGRILSYNWEDYDTMHVVIEPKQMTPQELYDGFKWAYRETFKFKHIFKRVAGLRLTSAVNLIGNMTYRIFVKRLYNEPRYAQPYSIDNPGILPDDSHWAEALKIGREEKQVLECCK